MEVELNQTANENNFDNNLTSSTENCTSDKDSIMPCASYSSQKSDVSKESKDEPEDQFAVIMEYLASNDETLCRSQQRDEQDISKEAKIKIISEIFEKSKSNFLSRFGRFLTAEQVQKFEQFQTDPKDGYEVMFHLKNISQMHSDRRRHKHLRNRRYAALKRLVDKNSYFSEIEMMRRNPLLYEQLVGRYLSAKEKKLRDRQSNRSETFVGILMNGIDNEQAEKKRKQQEDAEDAAMEEEDSDSSDEENCKSKPRKQEVSRFFWGEIKEDIPARIKLPLTDAELSITAQERKLLKEEFVSSMYESFLDGKDDDFDYDAVDNNDEYDNLEIVAKDEEEKYFDSEEPEDTTMDDDNGANRKEESSEDELDIYMSALNQHPIVCKLSEDLKKL